MTRTLISTTLAALLLTTSAHAADTRAARLTTLDMEPAARLAETRVATRIDGERIRYESEAQFQRDYGAHAEKLSPGVYLMNDGPFAGMTVSMGIEGLQYDLIRLQSRAREGGLKPSERGELQKRIAELQSLAREHDARQIREGFSTKISETRGFPCSGYDWRENRYVYYFGVAEAHIDGGLYMDRGDGSFNWYYSRMQATALIGVYPPINYLPYVTTYVHADARNEYSGEMITAVPQYRSFSASAQTGYLYNGPTFSHDLRGTATASAGGDCFGYLSLEHVFQM